VSQNVIQLINGVAVIVDNNEFFRTRRKFISRLHFGRFLKIRDVRGHIITIRKKDILLFEKFNEKEKIKVRND